MIRLPLLTNSRLACYRRCPREHYLRYVLGVTSARSHALRFGDLIHKGLETWWKSANSLFSALQRMTDACDQIPVSERPDDLIYDLMRAEAMLIGYDARWGEHNYEVLGVEEEFRVSLRNPATGAPARAFRLAGKLDVRVRDSKGRMLLIEHKTSSEDLSVGSPYWQRLRMDAQCSIYLRGAESLGERPEAVIYDVLIKPMIKPAKATPHAQRKYTQGKVCSWCKGHKKLGEHACTACEGRGQVEPPRLYAGQREADETPSEYRARVVEAIAKDPDRYYARGEVVRLDHERQQHDLELWEAAKQIRKDTVHLHNPDACVRYGSVCSYFPVCTGEKQIEDLDKLAWVHPELKEE